MAKVNAPLLSLGAKGRIGKLLIYYGEGKVRAWDTQVDPKTAAQLQSRAVVGAVMEMVKKCDGLDRAALRADFSKSWHVKFTAWLSRNSLANAKALHTEWASWSDSQRGTWESIVP